jgi:hypothetical protein
VADEVTRLSREGRTGLRAGAIACWALAALVFAGFITSVQGWMSEPPGFGDGLGPLMVLPFLAVGLFALGGFLARLGFAKPVSEILATETAGAAQVAGAAVGRGLREGMGAPAPAVKVRCRACGYLESEDAAYCSRCRAQV